MEKSLSAPSNKPSASAPANATRKQSSNVQSVCQSGVALAAERNRRIYEEIKKPKLVVWNAAFLPARLVVSRRVCGGDDQWQPVRFRRATRLARRPDQGARGRCRQCSDQWG